MALRINQRWADKMREDIDSGAEINQTLDHPITKKWLITQLVKSGRPYQVINRGGGVSTVTTAIPPEKDSQPALEKEISRLRADLARALEANEALCAAVDGLHLVIDPLRDSQEWAERVGRVMQARAASEAKAKKGADNA